MLNLSDISCKNSSDNYFSLPAKPPSSFSQHTATFNQIELVIIDSRNCLRDAMATALNTQFPRNIQSAADVATYIDNRKRPVGPRENSTPVEQPLKAQQLVIYCSGSKDESSVHEDMIQLSLHCPEQKTVLLTDTVSSAALELYNDQKINGIVTSSFNTRQLLVCLELIYSGVAFVPPELINDTISLEVIHKQNSSLINEMFERLTPRQKQVMDYIAKGRSNKYIAAELSLRESTVKAHVHELMKRLGASSRTHASYLIKNIP